MVVISLQGLALGMTRCGTRRFDDQWRTIGTYKHLRSLRLEGTYSNLAVRGLPGAHLQTFSIGLSHLCWQ